MSPADPAAAPTLLYCHCAYANVVPKDVREDVLRGLASSGVAFEAVPDLCEMSARKDPALERLAGCGALKIAACFPRAVHWLFHAGGSPLVEESVEVLNMRTRPAEEIVERALAADLAPVPFAEPAGEVEELAASQAGRGREDDVEEASS